MMKLNWCYCIIGFFFLLCSAMSCATEPRQSSQFISLQKYDFPIVVEADQNIKFQLLKPSTVQQIGGFRTNQIMVYADSALQHRMRIYEATSSVAEMKDNIRSATRNQLQSVIFEDDSTFFFVQQTGAEKKLNYQFYLNKTIDGIVYRFETDIFRTLDSISASRLFLIAQSAQSEE